MQKSSASLTSPPPHLQHLQQALRDGKAGRPGAMVRRLFDHLAHSAEVQVDVIPAQAKQIARP